LVRLADGELIDLFANLSSVRAIQALPADTAGVGLLRTEHVFGGESTGYEEQRDLYGALFERLPGRAVIVRTFDVSGDVPNGVFATRGVSRYRRAPAVLDTQLAAVSAAASATRASVAVMAPMVATAEDARWFATRAAGHGLDQAGVMVELPAAAVCADTILRVVRFASVGTNDLSQYLFAADRTAGGNSDLLDPWQPALLRLVRGVALAGTRLRRPVSVCGAAASDPVLAAVLVGMGVTRLSMPAGEIPAVRRLLGACTLRRCRALSALAVAASSARAARARVTAELAGHP
jgi:phosphotransferase system enzyme I (PtsI)